MNPEKNKLLKESYEKVIQVSLNMIPYEDISDLIDQKIMRYGTTMDEKLFSFQEYEMLIKSQAEQLSGLDPQFERNRITDRISQDENTAFFVEELTISTLTDYGENRLFTRTTCVMEYIDKQWKVTHWHGSSPVYTENDHWHVEEWKREKKKLRKQVDEQTAELQNKNRELEIEASLERVRAKAMTMHSTKDIESATVVVFNELSRLGIDMERCGIILMNETPVAELWSTTLSEESREVIDIVTGYLDFRIHPMLQQLIQHWREKKDYTTYKLVGDEVRNYYTKLAKQPGYKFPEADNYPDQQVNHAFNFSEGQIFVITKNELSAESKNILQRFTKVFEQTYTRFLDLQKAEAQAHEAEIEASLERIRAKAMAMNSTKDIESATAVVFNELCRLGIDMERCGICLMNETPIVELWSTTLSEKNKEVIDIVTGYLDFRLHPLLQQLLQHWREKKDYSSYKLVGDEVRKYYAILAKQPEYKFPEAANYPDQQIIHTFNFSEGALFVYKKNDLSGEAKNILQRFTRVFEQTYTRFLDLQKAEAQVREAQIEAALERIRSRSMAMQSSDELSEVVRVMYNEVEKIEISNWGCALMIFDNKNQNIQLWFSENVNNQHARPYNFGNLNHELVRKWWEFWESEDEFLSIHLKDEKAEEWTNYMFENTGMKDLPMETKEFIRSENEVYFEYAKMKQGLVSFIDLEPFPEEIFPLLKRIARTFEQAYTRFLDVERAEKLALETSRQASLDRIRAEIASMRSAEDLQQITPIIWDELKTLKIPFIRCGVFIIDVEMGVSHTYLSTSQGEPIAALRLPIKEFSLVENILVSWQNRKVYTEHFDKQGFRDWTQNLIDKGFIDSKEKYEAGSAPETLDLHFLPFKQGMLYIGNTEPLSKKDLDLGQSMAKAFSVAYQRYEDFNKLEQAKEKIEEAFRELEAAQDQLVQQEKLASLGQLTAGIAHEIKNPLNFVNNFSELSIELVEEAREEVLRAIALLFYPTERSEVIPATAKGQKAKMRRIPPSKGGASPSADGEVGDDTSDDLGLILKILDDIEANLRKIHEHGSRADGIVKSMLQHSRGGSGKKESTDLNALIKEYANLAFHGMRAGKDPINVDIELDLDENVGEVEMIVEDFSRVILNLCNNAFDAMRDKLSSRQRSGNQPSANSFIEGGENDKVVQGDDSSIQYKPKLTIRTHRRDQAVTIEIEDNGPGIPEEIKDKILQPFFTTKKGTQGTGLGLSITNDIIKAHGGQIDIESRVNKFTKISIHLNMG